MPARRRRKGKRRLGLSLGLLVVVLWLAGFVAFAQHLRDLAPHRPQQADGIVVLTGDRARLVAGLQLLADGRAERLLITGVNPATRLEDLAAALPTDPALMEKRVDLGRQAADTIGNADEAAAWAAAHDYRSLIIVTAGYHMPRSLVEFRHRMPHVTLEPYPVFPDSIRLKDWWLWPGTTRMLFVEYHKYLASRLINLFRRQPTSTLL